MGQFASTLFRLLLGWVQSAVSALWSLIVSPGSSGGLEWLLSNWLPLLILLCVAGALIDFAVYLLRWQPYRVWRAFLQGGRWRHTQHQSEEDPRYQRKWVYADGTTTLEPIDAPPAEQSGTQANLPIRPVRRVASYGGAERAYYQPVYPRQRTHAAMDSEGENE